VGAADVTNADALDGQEIRVSQGPLCSKTDAVAALLRNDAKGQQQTSNGGAQRASTTAALLRPRFQASPDGLPPLRLAR
jgi:hypothetical protein